MYQEIAVTSVTDIPALVASFASSAGWSVAGTVLTRPGGGESFTLGSSITGTNNQEKDVKITRNADTTKLAFARSPRLNGTSGDLPFVPSPSKVHCIGGTDPEAYLGIVIEYGFNLYRHLYVGNMEKIGSYTGGEIITGSNFPDTFSGSPAFGFNINYADFGVQYPFSSTHNYTTAPLSGGVHVVHADNPTYPWRHIRSVGLGFAAQFGQDETVALGGFRDSINDALISRAKSTYAGAGILVPVNMYAVRQGGADPYFSPLGRPAGVRYVRMDGIDPGQAIEVGNAIWRCFPVFRKSESQFVSRGTYWNASETSYLVGVAYLEDQS